MSPKRPEQVPVEFAFHAYTEDRLVEQSAIGLFAELGWNEGRA
jgi:hypothetical protein